MNNFSNYDPNQMMLENFTGSNNSGLQNQNMPFNNPHIASVGNLNNMNSIPNFSQGEIMNMSNNIDSLSTSGPMSSMGSSYPLNNNSMYGSQPYSNGAQSDLNGTNLNELSSGKEDNSSLIKSLTKEIISNLKENNIDLSDSKSRSSRSEDSESESSSRKKKKKKHTSVKEDLQDYMEEQNPVPSTNKYLSMIFSDSFNIKDFLLLFTLYFLLSQNMIKDFFSRYFTCLNPDEDGKIHVQGVIVYGLILTILFMLLKKVI